MPDGLVIVEPTSDERVADKPLTFGSLTVEQIPDALLLVSSKRHIDDPRETKTESKARYENAARQATMSGFPQHPSRISDIYPVVHCPNGKLPAATP